ncbi:TRAP transporter substrate-binding protein [Thermodesulfobacteriota bacterium]
MKTRMIKMLIISVVMVMMAISTTAILAEAKTINLKYAGLLPAKTTLAAPIDEWGKRVAERTKGQVKLTTYHSQALGKWLEYPKLSKSGLCEMFMAGGPSPGFALLGAGELPLMFPSQRIGMDVMYGVYRKGLLSSVFEGNGVKFLFFMNNDPRKIWFSKKRITNFSQLKGLKVRGTTPVHIEIAKALGATAVNISPADIYMALQRGTLDAAMNPSAGIFALKQYEALKYVIWDPLCNDLIAVVMNLKVWNSLPAEVRAVMLEVNEEMKYWHIEQYESDQKYQQMVREKGLEIFHLNKEEREFLHSKLAPVAQGWVEKMESRGVPAKKLVDEMKRLSSDY